MIAARLAKLKFVAEEMELAFHLTAHLGDPFVERTVARHILIRAENFIAHARGLRRPLNEVGYDTRHFHRTKEAYATAFEEYFLTSRHKLGAHVQDFDFGKRIELWNDIEIAKAEFFVEGAREIYRILGDLGVPGHDPCAALPELTGPALMEILLQFQREAESRTWVEMSSDPLASTRNNTSAVISGSPVHARAGQLALIRRWIAIETDLLKRLTAFPRIARIFKARIITDIVSFCDCLVTRPVSATAPQAMAGLDKLIAANGKSAAPIDDFVAASNYEGELQSARNLRDRVGAHVDIDDAYSIDALVQALDTDDLTHRLGFYDRVAAAFIKTCVSILYLRLYAADGQRMYGIRASRNPAVPYAGPPVERAEPILEPPPINDVLAYRKNLTLWLDGDETQKGDARDFFWGAFAGSEVVETVAEIQRFAGGENRTGYEFRKAHKFVLTVLFEGVSDNDFKGILDLILSCRSGWPYPLAEILVRYGRYASLFHQWLICLALGEIASAPHESVRIYLEGWAGSQNWPLQLQASIALFRTFVKNEGQFRINHKGQTRSDYDLIVSSLVTGMTQQERLVCLLAFASVMSSPHLGAFFKPFEAKYLAMQAEIEALCLPFLKDDDARSKASTLKQLMQTNDYIGACLLVALDLDGGDQHPLYAMLIDNCCNGSIVAAAHNQASRHLAMCFLLKKEHRTALDIVEPLASRNPDWLDIQVLVAQILCDTPGGEREAAEKVVSLRRAYKLTAQAEGHIAAVEAELTKRQAAG